MSSNPDNSKTENFIVTKNISKLFSKSNNKIFDSIFDFYYSLPPKFRVLFNILSYVLIISLIVTIIFYYIYSLNSLQKDAEASISSVQDISILKQKFESTNSELMGYVNNFKRYNSRISLNTLLQDLANNINYSDYLIKTPLRQLPLAASNPLSENFKKEIITVEFSKISLKNILEYLLKLEKQPNLLDVESISIEQVFQDKLYFNLTLTVSTYIAKS